MNKTELVDAVAAATEASESSVRKVVDATLEAIVKAVAAGDKVIMVGFGTFERRERAARTGRNPQTGATLKIEASKVPAFKAGAEFRGIVNGQKKAAPAKTTTAAKKR